MLADCRFCAHDCGVNRLAGETGLCHAGAETRFFSAQIEVSDEMELIPTFAMALSGCDLRCDFCITGASSWNPRAGQRLRRRGNGGSGPWRRWNGARTIMIAGRRTDDSSAGRAGIRVGLPQTATLVWKTNAHGSAQARELLDGMFDVWLADFKFGNDDCAQRLAEVPRLRPGRPGKSALGRRHSELIVRHLLMPGPRGMLLAAGGGMAGGESARRESEFALRLLAGVAGAAACGIVAERFHRRQDAGFCAWPGEIWA